MTSRKPWSFCEKDGNKCTMNMCDEYGCQERERTLVNEYPITPDECFKVGFSEKPVDQISVEIKN